jgi:hypothetical protein
MKPKILCLVIAFTALIAAAPVVGVATTDAAPQVAQNDCPYNTETPPAAGVSPMHPGTCPPDVSGRSFARGKHRMQRPMLAGMRHGGRGLQAPRHRDLHGRQHRGRLAAEKFLGHAELIELNDGQVSKLQELVYNTKKQLIDLRADVARERLEIQSLRRANSDDLAAFKRHLNVIAKTRADIEAARISHWIEARKVLTDEQKELLEKRRPMKRILHEKVLEHIQEDDD